MPESLYEATTTIDLVLSRAQLRVGTVVRQKWHVDVLLGVGGMAAVYAATHRNGSRVALKVLHPELCTHADIRTRFLREGYLANRIRHPGAVRVADDDVAEDGSPYLVMELLDGESLEDRRARLGGKLDVDEVLAAADQLLDVLAAAHEHGIVHRDIKPDNVFLTRDGVVKVLDFGIARLREVSSKSAATITGITMGTPCYMSPEQARGVWAEVDAQSDVWAVGATMFSLITGRLVHDTTTPNEALVSAMTTSAPAVRSVAQAVPRAAADVIDRALAFAKADRWADACAMQQAIRTAYQELHDAPISSCPPLSVPPSVLDRTKPSEGIDVPAALLAPTTGRAAAVGWTAISRSLATVPRNALFAGGVMLFGFVVVGLIVVVRVVAWRAGATPTSAVAISASTAPIVENSDGGAPLPFVSSTPSALPVVAVDELPTASSSGKAKPPPSAAPAAPGPRSTNWKERRK